MSIDAMSWAMDQDIFPSTAKFVLVCLCDNVGMDEVVFPSLETLCRKTSQDRKTVISCLDRLCELGLLSEEGTKNGGVKQYRIIGLPNGENHYVYRLTHINTNEFYIGVRTCIGDIYSDNYFGSGRWPQETGKNLLSKEILGIYATRKEAELAEAFLINSHKNSEKIRNRFMPRPWQVPKTEPVPKTVLVPKTEPHQYQKRNASSSENGTSPVPKTEHRIVNEPSIEPSREPSKRTKAKQGAFALPVWIEKESWDGFVAMRKAIRKPLTEQAMVLTVRELEKLVSQGENANAVLEQSIMNSWQGVFPTKGVQRIRGPRQSPESAKQEATQRAYERLFGQQEKEIVGEATRL